MVWVEDDAVHLVLVYSRGGARLASKALSRIHKRAAKGGKRVVVHVVSPLGRMRYMEGIRDLIRNNIAYTLTVRYHGGSPRDLENLVREYGGEADYIVEEGLEEYEAVLKRLGIEPVTRTGVMIS